MARLKLSNKKNLKRLSLLKSFKSRYLISRTFIFLNKKQQKNLSNTSLLIKTSRLIYITLSPTLIYITSDIENLTPKYQLLHKYGQLMQNTQKTRQIFVNIVQKQTFGLANVYKCETKYVYLSKKRSKAHILCVERS